MTSRELLVQMGRLALEGKTILVTGGSGGIGSSTATLFAECGCNVIITGSNKTKLDESLKRLKGGGQYWAYTCDLTNSDQVQATVQTIAKECPPVDILMNNAGFALAANAPFWEQDLANVDQVLGVNLNGLMTITYAVLKYIMMKRTPQPTGTILNISSITGHQAPVKEFFEASYHTSKAAVEGFTNVLRHELAGTNIRVLLNRPGTTRTEFHERRTVYDEEKTQAVYAGAGSPLVADDIAVSCLWQCLQPERISTVLVETLGTGQRSLYVADEDWEKRNGKIRGDEWN